MSLYRRVIFVYMWVIFSSCTRARRYFGAVVCDREVHTLPATVAVSRLPASLASTRRSVPAAHPSFLQVRSTTKRRPPFLRISG